MTVEPDRLQRLVDLVAHLRGPEGCPWDREQKLVDLRAYLLEEAHEAAAAIDSGDPDELLTELGDLLFEVAFVGRIAEELGWFSLDAAVERVERKMIERHPHVFGDQRLESADEVRRSWEAQKARDPRRTGSLLSGVATSLPALVAALRMTQKAAGVGFDWPDSTGVLDKVDEELAELRQELDATGEPRDRDAVHEELGDLLFSVANLARHLKIDPEAALASANLKFRRRFEHIESAIADDGRTMDQANLDEMERLWLKAKASH